MELFPRTWSSECQDFMQIHLSNLARSSSTLATISGKFEEMNNQNKMLNLGLAGVANMEMAQQILALVFSPHFSPNSYPRHFTTSSSKAVLLKNR